MVVIEDGIIKEIGILLETTNDYIILKKDGLVGVINKKAEITIPLKYSSIEILDPDYIILNYFGKKGVVIAGSDIKDSDCENSIKYINSYEQPKPTVQKPIYYQPPQEVIRRPFIDYDVDEYGNATDFNRDFESKDYRKTVGNYRNKRAKGYSLNAIELFRLAYSLCEIKQHHEAVKEWTTYILRFPNDSDLATAYNNRGVNYSKINEINKSTEDYKMAIKLGYSDSKKLREIIKNRESISMLETAKRYYSNKDYKNAVELYEKTISNGFDLSSYWFSYAYSLFELNKFDESVNAYTEFIDKNPNSNDIPAAYNNIAIGLFKLNKNDEGFEDYWKAYSKYPSDEKKMQCYQEYTAVQNNVIT